MFRRRRNKKRSFLGTVYSFAVTWALFSFLFPLYRIDGLISVALISCVFAFFFGKALGRSEGENAQTEEYNKKAEGNRDYSSVKDTKRASERTGNATEEDDAAPKVRKRKKSYGKEIDDIVDEGNLALGEMGRLYMSIKDNEVRAKINEIMRITDKITQDAIEDPSDIPQIRKFFRYYLPTTIKLLNSYDRMSSQEIEGENISKSMKSITEMLDVAIAAYKKRLDSLFENQALDIETDIDVMNQMLEREGLTGNVDFHVGKTNNNTGAAAQAAAAEIRKE